MSRANPWNRAIRSAHLVFKLSVCLSSHPPVQHSADIQRQQHDFGQIIESLFLAHKRGYVSTDESELEPLGKALGLGPAAQLLP